jgi:hypothetical protein
VKLVVAVRLFPDAAQAAALRDTLAMCNQAANYVSAQALDAGVVGLADEFAFADADERFELLIDIFVDGLARQAAGSRDD